MDKSEHIAKVKCPVPSNGSFLQEPITGPDGVEMVIVARRSPEASNLPDESKECAYKGFRSRFEKDGKYQVRTGMCDGCGCNFAEEITTEEGVDLAKQYTANQT